MCGRRLDLARLAVRRVPRRSFQAPGRSLRPAVTWWQPGSWAQQQPERQSGRPTRCLQPHWLGERSAPVWIRLPALRVSRDRLCGVRPPSLRSLCRCPAGVRLSCRCPAGVRLSCRCPAGVRLSCRSLPGVGLARRSPAGVRLTRRSLAGVRLARHAFPRCVIDAREILCLLRVRALGRPVRVRPAHVPGMRVRIRRTRAPRDRIQQGCSPCRSATRSRSPLPADLASPWRQVMPTRARRS